MKKFITMFFILILTASWSTMFTDDEDALMEKIKKLENKINEASKNKDAEPLNNLIKEVGQKITDLQTQIKIIQEIRRLKQENDEASENLKKQISELKGKITDPIILKEQISELKEKTKEATKDMSSRIRDLWDQIIKEIPRKLMLDIRSSFHPQKIEPDRILFDDKKMKDGSTVKPGVYKLTIEKKGYESIKEELIVPPSEDPYVLSKLMEPSPHLVTYEVSGDFEPGELQPDAVTLDGKTVDGKTPFLPNKYTLKIEKKGYKPIERPEIIQPSDTPYVIRDKLLSLPRELEFRVIGDWPPDDIPVEVIALNGQEYDNTPQKPGQYALDIRHTGFFPLKEKIVITPDIVPFLIERVLKTKPVLLETKISFDVPPGDLGTDYKITIAPWEDKKSIREIHNGDTLKPGEYEIIVTKPAYKDIKEKLRILPREKPFKLDYQLEANLIEVHVKIDYDIPPPPDLGEYEISLIDVKTGYPRAVRNGGKIKPGQYYLDIQQPGYQITAKREIKISPSLHPFEIKEKLIAKR